MPETGFWWSRHSHIKKKEFGRVLDLSALQLGLYAKSFWYEPVEEDVLLGLLNALQDEEAKLDWEERSRAHDQSNPEVRPLNPTPPSASFFCPSFQPNVCFWLFSLQAEAYLHGRI